MTKKAQNIYRNPDNIYFSIDDENYPYKGVKGRAVARISEDIQKNLPIVEKINIKYLGAIKHPLANAIIENTRNGIEMLCCTIRKTVKNTYFLANQIKL